MEKSGLFWLLALSLSGLVSACQPIASSGKSKRYSAADQPAETGDVDTSKKTDSDTDDVVLDDREDETVTPEPAQVVECYKAEKLACDLEKEVFELTNNLRKQEGKSPLKLSPELSWTARKWSDQMGRVGVISHAGFPGARNTTFREEFGSSTSMTAENVAMNYTGTNSVAATFYKMWETSRGHRVNMLSNAGSIGIGIAKNSRGAWYATQIFGR